MKSQMFFYFDRIRINSTQNKTALLKSLPVYELKGNSKEFFVRKPFYIAKKIGFKSRLEIIAPTEKALMLLAHNESVFLDYRISYVEIARDTLQESNKDAEQTVVSLGKSLRKKYSQAANYFHKYSRFDDPTAVKKYRDRRKYWSKEYLLKFDEEHFGILTLYLGKRPFQYVVYARISKVIPEPCLHEEWRISGKAKIKNKIGIVTLGDLAFDIERFFQKQDEKYLSRDLIDHHKLGKWLLGIQRQRKFSDREMRRISLYGTSFCCTYEAYTFAKLVQVLSDMKKEIKCKKGRRSAWDNKILSINNYGRFSKSI